MDNATWFAFFKPSNRPLLQDMIDLETSGISLEIPFARQIKVGFMIHCGDNLESHSLGGFKTSFSGGYICRVCHIHHKEIKQKTHDWTENGPNKYWSCEEFDRYE